MKIEHLIPAYKYGQPVLTGSGVDGTYNRLAVDCPTVFTHNGKYMMLHIGFDGTGYQTALAESDDLIHWRTKGAILERGSNMDWDKVGMAGNSILMEKDLYGGNRLMKWQGKYWLLYHAYPGEGYEIGPAEMGLAWTEDEELMDWHFVGEPVFSWKGGGDWEQGGLYKGDLTFHDGKFYLFYNAKCDVKGRFWTEQTGMAVSDDLIHWTRPFMQPVLPATEGAWDSQFASDPQVFWDSREKQWVMFYFGLGKAAACDGIAVSKDLYHWKKFPAPILTIGGMGELDSTYAHKPGVIYANGALYHFYCAVRPYREGDPEWDGRQFRCITVARTRPWDWEEKYAPLWNTDTVHHESVAMVRDENGRAEAQLLFDPIEILKVENRALGEIYDENKDYTVQNGRLVLTENSRIFAFTQADLFPENPEPGTSFPMPGGNSLFHEGDFFVKRQISVTYRCEKGQWKGVKPTFAGEQIPRVTGLLKRGEKVNILLYGDSISNAANNTCALSLPPYEPGYGEMLIDWLREESASEIDFTNTAVGGWETNLALERMDERVCAYQPDLVILAFGMNDGGKTLEAFVANTREIIRRTREASPDCEFILVATSLPNPILTDEKARFWSHQEHHMGALSAIAQDTKGVAVADIGGVHRYMMERKKFLDLSSNNVNHPNGFFYRIHTNFLREMLIEE